jgi:hypothetical protein
VMSLNLPRFPGSNMYTMLDLRVVHHGQRAFAVPDKHLTFPLSISSLALSLIFSVHCCITLPRPSS